MRRLELAITPELAGVKVDTLLKRHMGLSGTVVRRIKWLDDGILVDGVRVNTRFCPEAVPVASFKEALDLAVESGGALIACGSFYMAGELRPLLLEKFPAR